MAWFDGLLGGEAALHFVGTHGSNGISGGGLDTRRQENCGSLYDDRSISFHFSLGSHYTNARLHAQRDDIYHAHE